MVFDCTVPEAHVDVTLTAFETWLPRAGEKPLADSMENAQKMVAAAQDAGKNIRCAPKPALRSQYPAIESVFEHRGYWDQSPP